MLEKNNIKPSNYMNYIQEIAKNAGIDINAQESNVAKTSKRGRKPKALK